MTKISWFENSGEDVYNGYNMSKLEMDQAYVTAASLDGTTFTIYKRHKECIECFYKKISVSDNVPFVIENIPQYAYRIYSGSNLSETVPFQPTSDLVCDINKDFDDFGEFGIYRWQVFKDACHISILKEPVSSTLPIITVLLIYSIILAAVLCITHLWRKANKDMKEEESNQVHNNDKPRFQALDTLRGMTMVCIIFGTYGAGGYKAMDHTVWNGIQIGDLLFPWLLWMMGVCIPLSMKPSVNNSFNRRKALFKVFFRSAKLFCVGFLLGLSQNEENFRVFGVLQRFALSYFVAAIIYLYVVDKDFTQYEKEVPRFHDLKKLCRGWIIVLVITALHTLITFFVAEPGCPKGYLGPGGWHKSGKYLGCTGGAAGYIDRLLFTNHIYTTPTIKNVYNSQDFDPEGLLGTLTAIGQIFLGLQAGTIFVMYKNHFDRLVRWLCWALVTGLLGGVLCGFSKDDGFIPINKNLWSLSFVLVTSSLALFLLTFIYTLMHIKNWWSGKPFLFVGMNAFVLYFGQFIAFHQFPMKWRIYYDGNHPTHFMVLFENTWVVGFWILLSYYLYKIDFFFNI